MFHRNKENCQIRPHHAPIGAATLSILALLSICLTQILVFDGSAQTRENRPLDEVLRQMETLGKTFRSFSAKFTQKNYNAILKEFDTPESGTFEFARAKDGSSLLRQEIAVPGRRILTIKAGMALVYQPSVAQAQKIVLEKNKDKAEFLALGLGQSPSKLKETFELRFEGNEEIQKVPCSILALKPKSAQAAAFFSTITLWLRKRDGLPIQQKMLEPNGNYLLVIFSEEKLNPRILESRFEQNLPRGTDIQLIR